eukprot:scaffold15163_cov125-Isochrysis_galbana.AAC.1
MQAFVRFRKSITRELELFTCAVRKSSDGVAILEATQAHVAPRSRCMRCTSAAAAFQDSYSSAAEASSRAC